MSSASRCPPPILPLLNCRHRVSQPIRPLFTARPAIPRTSSSSSSSFVQRRRLQPLRSGVSVTSLAVAGLVSFGVAYLSIQYIYSQTTTPPEVVTEGEEEEETTTMAAPYGNAPGRPGNLTPDQEAKLKEMWIALSHIAGIEHATAGAGERVGKASTDMKPDSASETPSKKKSRFGFGRSKKDKSEESTDGGLTNDKHGQTKEYEQALASLTPNQIRDALWIFSKHDDPDALLLRFLRARKWDVQNALIMLISTMHWRLVEQHVDDDIMLHGEGHAFRESLSSNAAEKKEGDDFIAQLRMGKSFLHGVDKDGRPCCYVRVRLHRQGEQSEKSLERFTVYTIETARMMLRPPVDTATIVFDMTDFSMANMDYTPVKFMIKCFEANYPESLGSVVVYKSPWIFQGIWKIIKGWLDPVVASKVHFASNVSDLEEYIPKSQIMKELDGDEDWTYSYPEPQPGEDSAMQDTQTRDRLLQDRSLLVDQYEKATTAWMSGEVGGGGDDGTNRTQLSRKLATNYWQLDPFVRARSMYDRTGVLSAGGKLVFYPKEEAANTADDDVD